ncbi:outer membrane protein [Dysgonomonas sp. 520]|uniref:outer membrane protein n=1 Tax=Dysgonomonas sp. 520 TaxID=2302931 RepID=UPI0013D36AE0|nr:outer membrane beta-barrel protein [Dysgonomonas sp. 520]NDW09401.1 porin family protein [Dysgonomonas sp. 520]
MKKILFLVAVLFAASISMSAQKGNTSVLANIGYQTDYERFGVGAQFRYNLLNNVRIAPDLMVFFPKNKVTGLDLNLNVHYVINLKPSQLSFYPLVGFSMQNNFWGKKTVIDTGGIEVRTKSKSSTDLAFNLGGGISYNLDAKNYLNAEGKFMFGDNDCAVIMLGYGIRF